MQNTVLVVMYYAHDRIWVAKDDRHPNITGQGRTPESAISDLRDILQEETDLDTPVWAWRGPFDESHL